MIQHVVMWKVKGESTEERQANAKALAATLQSLRGKIHGTPDAGDAERVRAYARTVTDPVLRGKYEQLAEDIDAVYQAAPLPELLEADARRYTAAPWLQTLLRNAASDYAGDASAGGRYRTTANLLAELRDALPRIRSALVRVDILDLSLAVEAANFSASVELREQLPRASRIQRVAWLHSAIDAAYGAGVINQRGRREQQKALARLDGQAVSLGVYLEVLAYLGRVPGWGLQGLRYQFYESMQKLSNIEPMAMLFIQDQLRGSPLLFFSQVLDGLSRDANQLAGVKHRLFGESVGVGFTALNPGLARGVLHANADPSDFANFRPDGIYMLPETVSDLPPVAGILTMGEGNPLSHVQLLARNLGIPNVTVDQFLIEKLSAFDGREVVLNAGSDAGLEIGQSLQITRRSRPLTDPVTGELLGYREHEVGIATVTEVQERLAFARFRAADDSEAPARNDLVTLLER